MIHFAPLSAAALCCALLAACAQAPAPVSGGKDSSHDVQVSGPGKDTQKWASRAMFVYQAA